ncbi:MAG: HAD-IIB family hydrolase [Phycisphaerae bacterium]|nr:HAD-IIB family hydrolase [Phycisphaerae bacterium]
MPPRYDMLAIDLDGTLLNSSREVSDANLRALDDARAAGLRVVICTGRALPECAHTLDRIAQNDPVAVAGGSIIACPRQRRTLHRFALDPDLVASAARTLLGYERPVLILKDPEPASLDYVVVHGTGRHDLEPDMHDWFARWRVRVRFVEHVEQDEHPDHTVRFGVSGPAGRLARIAAELERQVQGRAVMHAFGRVIHNHAGDEHPDDQPHILEIFDARASKWSAIRWLADHDGIPAQRICAIGDEVNDLPMIAQAGLGIAMGNAVPSVRAAARRQTLRHDEDGVAHAIRRVLDGEW